MNSILRLYCLACLAIVLSSCASLPPDHGIILDPKKDMESLETDLSEAKSRGVDSLAPLFFKEANASYDKATQSLTQKESLKTIQKHLYKARQSLENAWATASIAGPIMDLCKKARKKAIDAGAEKLGLPFETAETSYEKLKQSVQNQNIVSIRRNGPKLQSTYRDLEIMAIENTYLSSARASMTEVEDIARTRVPAMYAKAQTLIDDVEKQIKLDPYDRGAIIQKTKQTESFVGRMEAVAHSAAMFASMSPEESALYLEKLVTQLCLALGLSDVRDKPVDEQVDRAVASAHTLRNTLETLEKENKRNQIMLTRLERRLYAMTANQEEIVSKRMAARDNSRMLMKMRQVFSPDEAEVYTRGHQFVIRLKDMDFPEGQATLNERNIDVLNKVQDAIRKFDSPRVTIEGYTDANGTGEMADLIAQMRASAVKAYLVGKKTLPPDKILTIGYDAASVAGSNSMKPKGIQVWINPVD